MELYETAAQVYHTLDRFAAVHGSEAIVPVTREISAVFQQLERLIAANGAEKVQDIKAELEHVMEKIESVRRERLLLGEKFDQVLYCPVMLSHFSPAPVKTDRAVRIQ